MVVKRWIPAEAQYSRPFTFIYTWLSSLKSLLIRPLARNRHDVFFGGKRREYLQQKDFVNISDARLQNVRLLEYCPRRCLRGQGYLHRATKSREYTSYLILLGSFRGVV